MRVPLRVSCLVAVLFLVSSVRAEEKAAALPLRELDQRLIKSLGDTIDLGAATFNNGDQEGCYRIYQGALKAVLPLLEHHAALQKAVDQKVSRAVTLRTAGERAFLLREAIDEVRSTLARGAGGTAVARSLWDRLGGEPAVRAVVHDFVVAAAGDPKVNFDRDGKFKLGDKEVKQLERLLVELVSAVGGGPLKYSGRSMKEAHKGMMITDDEFNALAGHLIATLKKYKVPEKEMDELVGAVAGTRKDIVEAKARPSAEKSLYERLGGEAAIKAVVDDFVARAAGNPKVNFTRKGTPAAWDATPENVAKLKKHLVELIGMVTGGPQKYEGRNMKEAHKGMQITAEEFDALAADLKATLDKFKVPAKEQEELFKIIGSTKDDIVEKK
jgi:hemoglobin